MTFLQSMGKAWLAMAGVTLVGAMAATAVASGATRAADDPSQLAWGACAPSAGSALDPRQECATVQVPMDYTNPDTASIPLRISRIRTTRSDLRRGVLLLIPGGPGNSGLALPSAKAAKLPPAVLDRYDLVSLDPRGVGQSSPVSCQLAPADLDLLQWPAPDGDISANVAKAQRTAAACATNGGPLLRTISTVTEARDVDRIRQALGEQRLSYWGVSYGTYVGAVYATMFAQHTDRVLLDSNDDPNSTLVERQWLANYQIGIEDRFPDFAAWASAPGNPDRIADAPAAVRGTFLDLAARLDRSPLPWPGANPPELTGNALRETLLRAMFADSSFPGLAAIMLAALHSTPLPTPGVPPEQLLQNTDAVAVATICDDVTWPGTVADHTRAVAISQARYPLTGGMPANIGPCSYWPYPLAQQPVRVTPNGPSNVLLVQNLRDPATPYSGALNLLHAFGDRARMVTVDSGGHQAYLANGNSCGDQVATTFLVTGQRPPPNAFCPAEHN